MSKSITQKFKKPSRGQLRIIGRHAEDGLESVAAGMGASLEEVQVIVEDKELQKDFQLMFQKKLEKHRLVNMPHVLQRKAFDPEKFSGLGKGWKIAEYVGKRVENILDAGKISRKDYLEKGKTYLNGEKRLERIKANPSDIQLDGEDFLALYEEEGQKNLRWLYDTKGMTWLSFWGIVLQSPFGSRCVLCLYREDDGSWSWSGHWLDNDNWGASNPSAVLAS